jgi:hypothetical protein
MSSPSQDNYKSDILEELHPEGQETRPEYSPVEIEYLGGLKTRLQRAYNQRNQNRPEFDGMSYQQYWEANERGANTILQPKTNREDSNFQSGTIRQKILALLAALINLDLSPDVHAYDQNEIEINGLGDAIEDTFEKAEELDNDAEKKIRRQYELLKQGDVFVETVWDEKFFKDKKLKGSKTFDGKIEGVSWTTKLKRLYARPVKNIISGISVFLGDITIYDSSEQPFLFTVEQRPYGETEAKFKKWERWKYVNRDVESFGNITEAVSLYNNWRLTDLQKDHCEIIRYQDKWNNEYAVVINGVLMTPVGLPLPWGYCDYNIVQQGFAPIHEKFAYHESLVKRLRNNVAVYDEMVKMAVLKTQKSFGPPYLNFSGQVVSRRIFMPFAITNAAGISKGDLVPVHDKEVEGVTQSEFNMIQKLMDNLNEQSVSPIFQGQNPSGTQTATQVLEVQRQAKLMMGLTVAAASMLEWKLAWQMLYVVLKNWFEPVDDKLDEARQELINVYRNTNVSRPVKGKGMGRRITVPVDKENMPTPDDIYNLEEDKSDSTGIAHRFMFINVEVVKSAKLIWQIVIRPREKRTSEISKLLFRAEMADAQLFGPTLNIPYWQEKFSNVWDEDPSEAFTQSQPAAPSVLSPEASGSGSIPTPPDVGAGLNQTMKNQLSQ